MAEKQIGEVTHYWGKIRVAGIKLTGTLQVGDTVHFLGHTTDFEQKAASIQIEGENIEEAKKGQEVGLEVKEKVRAGDKVYKVEVE